MDSVNDKLQILSRQGPRKFRNIFDQLRRLFVPLLKNLKELEQRVALIEGSLTLRETDILESKSVADLIREWEKL